LVLTPKPGSSFARDYKRMEFWVDLADGLPRQIVTVDNSRKVLTVRFCDLQANPETRIEPSLFEEGKLPDKWDREEKDLTEEPPAEKK